MVHTCLAAAMRVREDTTGTVGRTTYHHPVTSTHTRGHIHMGAHTREPARVHTYRGAHTDTEVCTRAHTRTHTHTGKDTGVHTAECLSA